MKRLLTAVLLIFSTAILADTNNGTKMVTAKKLIPMCMSTDKTESQLCYGFVIGVIDGLNVASMATHDHFAYCFPKEVPMTDIAQRLVVYIRDAMKEDPAFEWEFAGSIQSMLDISPYKCSSQDKR